MNQEELDRLTEAWLEYHRPGASLAEQEAVAWFTDIEYDLSYNEPEELWKLILSIHRKDHSSKIQEVLSAGPVEDLLTMHGELFIERVEKEAKSDPIFAQLLGGVWKCGMDNSVWTRLQAAWDRRGWDGIPE